jgi:penicillin-binding protein 2
MNPYKKQPNTKVRFNIITFVIYLIGIVLLLRLFSLQIINGATYRETSNTRLTRESTIYASRGNITDSSGNLLATVDVGYNLELYKTNLEDEELNQTLLNIINT